MCSLSHLICIQSTYIYSTWSYTYSLNLYILVLAYTYSVSSLIYSIYLDILIFYIFRYILSHTLNIFNSNIFFVIVCSACLRHVEKLIKIYLFIHTDLLFFEKNEYTLYRITFYKEIAFYKESKRTFCQKETQLLEIPDLTNLRQFACDTAIRTYSLAPVVIQFSTCD